jgi:hypothetical protein
MLTNCGIVHSRRGLLCLMAVFLVVVYNPKVPPCPAPTYSCTLYPCLLLAVMTPTSLILLLKVASRVEASETRGTTALVYLQLHSSLYTGTVHVLSSVAGVHDWSDRRPRV